MRKHTTNYIDTFIEVAEDCKATMGCPPQDKEPKTAARNEKSKARFTNQNISLDEIIYANNQAADK